MPDGVVQWFDARTGEGRVVRGSREYPLRAEDAESAACHAGARVHFDIVREAGAARAVHATLREGTRVSRRQRRFGDLTGARTPDAKGSAPFAHPRRDLAGRTLEDPQRIALLWAHRMEDADLDGAVVLYAPDAVLHDQMGTVSGTGRLVDRLEASPLYGLSVDVADVAGPEAGVVTLRWDRGADLPAIETRLRIAHGEIAEQWIGPPSPPQPETGEAPTVGIDVTLRGGVPDEAVAYARRKFTRLARQAGAPVLFARVKLARHGDPAMARPMVVEAVFDVNGRLVRAHCAAHTFDEAVDLAERRLRDRFDQLARLHEERYRHPAELEPGEWRHGTLATRRPAHFPRPSEERQVVRRKAFPIGEASLEEAAFDLELLDHDFHLFREAGVEGDSLLVRRPDGGYGLWRTVAGQDVAAEDRFIVEDKPVPVLDVEEAVERMNATGDPFVFFRHRDTGRGNLVYWRYDGHYGLIEPAG